MLVKVYDNSGKAVSQTRLPSEIFGVEIKPDFVHEVAMSQQANRRQVSAHTKSRAQVRGGGKKPWRQKGTGRARHGSIRSPLWRGGGVTFGPTKEKVFKKKINKKKKKLALFMVLSGKAKEGLLVIVDDLKMEKPKTGQMKSLLEKLPCKKESCLIVLPAMEKNVILSSRNIPGVKTFQARDLSALDLLSFKYLLMPKESLKVLKETFAE